MQEAVENSMKALASDDDTEIRRLSSGSGWARGRSLLKRTETIKALKHRASEYNRRKPTLRNSKMLKSPDVDTIEEIDDEEPNNKPHFPVKRTNTYKDPEDLDERDV